QAVAPLVGIEVSSIDSRGPAQIERAIATFARRSNGGMIQVSGPVAAYSNLLIAAAARYKLPAVYVARPQVAAGGLISYGPNFEEQSRTGGNLRNPNIKGKKPCRSARAAPEQVRPRHQPQDRQGAWSRRARDAARPRRRGDRVT